MDFKLSYMQKLHAEEVFSHSNYILKQISFNLHLQN